MNSTFSNEAGKPVVMAMVRAIQQNKDYLGTVDGLIGDGDHGMNMNKGFTVFATRNGEEDFSFSEGLSDLSMILLNEIGGSMGPIYGTLLMEMGSYIDDNDIDEIGLGAFTDALKAGMDGLYEIVEARPGDKTLVDTLSPAIDALRAAQESGKELADALQDMKAAAEAGRDSTKDMVARYGRSSRLGERSRGVLDAGACSCCILLEAMADGITALL